MVNDVEDVSGAQSGLVMLQNMLCDAATRTYQGHQSDDLKFIARWAGNTGGKHMRGYNDWPELENGAKFYKD